MCVYALVCVCVQLSSAARQGSAAVTSEDRRIDQVVGVLDRYGVVVGA